MGTDKSALRIAGRRVLGRLCELLADRLGEVRIIGRRPDPRDVPACAAWHPDVQEGLGPLGGIVSALHVAEAGVCAVACDMVALGGNLLDGLLSGRNREAVATVPVNPTTGRLEPLAAIYEPAAAPSIRQALDAGTRSVTEWLESAGAHRLPIPPDLAPELTDADTPEDLQKLGTGT